ncbi:MAG: hypothetical protein HYV97_11205 [Bdellovibrio sp.]|nr:hypothetical protein [Bdellovibrio sp.]
MTNPPSFAERIQTYLTKKDIRGFPYDGQYLEAESIELLVTDATLLAKILSLIENAKVSILIHIYSLKEDHVGNQIIQALARQAQNGISVKLMTDAVGTNLLSAEMITFCVESGIHWMQFNPPFESSFIAAGRRAHHKVFLFDHTKLMIAGFNLGNTYLGTPNILGPNGHQWHDYGIYLESRQLNEVEAAIMELYRSNMIKPLYNSAPPFLKPKTAFRVLFQDGQSGLRDISRRITHALKHTTEEILIAGAYFFPDQYFLYLLIRARKRGVKVSIIVSEQSDVRWVKWASFHFIKKLLKNGCEVYAIHNNILHAKALMIDQKWLTLGSYNFHFTSQFFNVEANVETTAETVLQSFRQNFFDTIINKSTPMDLESLHRQENPFSKIRNFLSYQLSLILHTFYLAHSKINSQE